MTEFSHIPFSFLGVTLVSLPVTWRLNHFFPSQDDGGHWPAGSASKGTSTPAEGRGPPEPGGDSDSEAGLARFAGGPPGRMPVRPGNPQFPFPRFPIRPGNGEGIPDSRSAGNRESGNGPFPDSAGKRESGSRLAANREIGGTLRCEYSWAGCCLESFKYRFRPPPTFFLNCQGPADGG